MALISWVVLSPNICETLYFIVLCTDWPLVEALRVIKIFVKWWVVFNRAHVTVVLVSWRHIQLGAWHSIDPIKEHRVVLGVRLHPLHYDDFILLTSVGNIIAGHPIRIHHVRFAWPNSLWRQKCLAYHLGLFLRYFLAVALDSSGRWFLWVNRPIVCRRNLLVRVEFWRSLWEFRFNYHLFAFI